MGDRRTRRREKFEWENMGCNGMDEWKLDLGGILCGFFLGREV
jgi:hypothetical protein